MTQTDFEHATLRYAETVFWAAHEIVNQLAASYPEDLRSINAAYSTLLTKNLIRVNLNNQVTTTL